MNLHPRRLPGWLNAGRFLFGSVAGPTAADRRAVERVRGEHANLRSASDAELAERVNDLRDLVVGGQPVESDAAIHQGLPLVIEAARRTLGIDYYDVQILAGLALTRGCIAEMQTGEGKTFAAALSTIFWIGPKSLKTLYFLHYF